VQEPQRKQSSSGKRWSWQRVREQAAEETACETPRRKPHLLSRIYCYVRRLADAYAIHQCSLMACACAYCAILSLIPLLVVGIAVFGYFLGSSSSVLEQVLHAAEGFAPKNVAFVNGVREILDRILQDRGLIGLFGMLGLLYAAHQTFLAMQPAMNLIWGVPETRHWLRQRLIAFAATFYALLLIGADLALTTFFTYLESLHVPLVSYRFGTLVYSIGVGLLPMMLTTLLFALLYQSIPSRAVPWKAAFLGAVVAALLWEATKLGFGIFLLHVNNYDRLYGSLGSLVILVVWIYYSMAILLLGAEIAADYEATRYGLRVAEARAHSGVDLAVASGAAARHPETPPARTSIAPASKSVEPPPDAGA
jgi:membrane protein